MADTVKRDGVRTVSVHDLFPVIGQLLEEGKTARIPVSGNSMWPFLCHGRDSVVLSACDPARLRRGDIVLLQTARGNYLLHRVVRVSERGYVTAGDGNLFEDGTFSAGQLCGVVVMLERKGRQIACTQRCYRLLSAIWMAAFPVRRPLLRLLLCIGRVKRALRRNKTHAP